MHVPSRLLQRHGLEILITSLNTTVTTATALDPAGLVEAMLVPPLQTPVAASGRPGFVRYPVHKAIVVAEGVEGTIDFGRISTALESTALGQTGTKERLIHAALSMPLIATTSPQKDDSGALVSTVDIDQAGAALDLFRQDVANGPAFNAKWQGSNIDSVRKAITSESTGALDPEATQQTALRPALQHHIISTLDSTTAAITAAEQAAHTDQITNTIPESTRASLQTAISTWSQHAHTDLQVSLATALASRSWRRTSWSRLLWRVDDVGVAAEAVLRNHWLLDAEAGLAFLAGRVEQAGFFRSNISRSNFNPDFVLHAQDRAVDKTGAAVSGERAYLMQSATATTPETTTTTTTVTLKKPNLLSRIFMAEKKRPTPAQLLGTDTLVTKVHQQSGINILHTRPWPLAIHFRRQSLLHTLVPVLQHRAQSLLLQALSTIGGTSALGGWIYVATKGVGVYEAGAAAALGFVWACRRLQGKWEDERRAWEGEIREAGRVVLADVEEDMRRIVREKERPALRADDVKRWMEAREAVREAEEALKKRAESAE